MGLYKTTPPLSGRMGALWCLSGIADSAVIEYGCMGHMAYGRTFLNHMGAFGSKLYSTHIGETDIAMGDTSRLTKVIRQILDTERIKTIFLLPSSVPEITGIDLAAIAQELSPQFPDSNLIPLSVGGFDMCGHKGIELTLLQLVKTLSKNTAPTPSLTFNIIGSCADMYNFLPDAAEIERLVSNTFSARLLCAMTSGTHVSKIEAMGGAHFNLVIRREGEAAARYLKERFGTPYLMARPYGIDGTRDWLRQLEKEFKLLANKEFIQQEYQKATEQIKVMQTMAARFLRAHKAVSKLTLAGHADVTSGIAKYGKRAFGFDQTICYCDCACMNSHDIPYTTDEIKLELAKDNRGFLMGNDELLGLSKRKQNLQIASPDNLWHHAYEPPLVGYRGAVHLATVWANEIMQRD